MDTVSYDASGNQDATWGKTTLADQTQIAQESRSYYAADERLTYYDRHDGWGTPGLPSGVFEEYRYDALGRRVLVRSRRPTSCAYPCEAYTQRTVWDGDQVFYELRASAQAGYLENDGVAGPGEDQNLFGIVAYAQGPGLDQPVGVLKKYTTLSWAYVTPHQNWQGDWNHGSFSTGALCLAVGATCPSWPGDVQLADNGIADFPTAYTVWWGTLIQGGATGSGLQYLRNRYYDPARGRFTQPDPIGLGGGMNLYGFASGDPVNFSDPMGLKVDLSGLDRDQRKLIDALRKDSKAFAKMFNAIDRLPASEYLLRVSTASGAWVNDVRSRGDGWTLRGGIFGNLLLSSTQNWASGSEFESVVAHEFAHAAAGLKGGTPRQCYGTAQQEGCAVTEQNRVHRDLGLRERRNYGDNGPFTRKEKDNP